MKFLENVARDLCACQRLVDLCDDDVVISRLRILYRKPGFQEKSLEIVSLMSNNSDTSKIHFELALRTWQEILESRSNIETALQL